MATLEESVFDPTFGGTLVGQTAADENVFDPSYGGILRSAGDENVFDPSYGGTVTPFLPDVTAANNITSSVLRPSQTYQPTFDNPLFDYENYTYNISWHILTVQDYNALVANPNTKYVPMNCLIASGGKNTATFARNVNFVEDFYFDDLKILTVVNTKNYNKNSNAITIDFTVIEPNGFTLLNRLQDAVASVNGPNYLSQPYLLMIEFTGYKDGTVATIPNQTKYIPMSLISMKTNITPKGAEYRVSAVPYNHKAFDETMIKTPALIKVQAKSVQDLLGTLNASDPNTVAAINAARSERAEAIALNNDPEFNNFATAEALDATRRVARSNIEYSSQGLVDGINSWLQSVSQNTQAIRFPSIYRVVFDPEIGNSALVVPNSNQGSNNISNSATSNDSRNNVRAAAGINVGAIDFNAGVFSIKPGTSILSVIDYAVRNSKYVTSQLVDPLANNVGISQFRLKFGQSLRWYRVIPSIKLGQYDPVTKKYQMFVTFYIKPWTVSVKNPFAPLGRAEGYTKKYDYIFTGQNRDVLDCKIDFDMLFYLQLTADPNKVRQTETGGASTPDTNVNGSIIVPNSLTQPIAVNYVSSNQTTSVRTGPDQAKAVRGADTQRDLTLNSRGDMINVQLRIVGDPHFIKQDDLFLNQNLTPTNSMFVSNNNQSLVFDDGELYVYLNIVSPTDYADNTGLAIPGVGKYQYSAFSGVYKIITVNNEFRAGKFEQVLDLVRIPIEDQVRNVALNIQSRTDRLISQGLGQLTAFTPTRFTGPLILVNQTGTGLGGAIVNAALTGGASGIGGLVQGLVAQVAGQVANQLVGRAVNGIVSATGSVLSQAGRDIKDALGIPRGLTAADENIFDPTYGGTLSGLGSGSVGAGAESVFDPSFGGELPIGDVDFNIGDIGSIGEGVVNFDDWDLGVDFGSLDDAGFIDYGEFI